MIESAAFHWGPQTVTLDLMIEKDSNNYDLLVAQGDNYYAWANDVMEMRDGHTTGAYIPLWLAAASYYQRALTIRDDEPTVVTDLAVGYFYAGWVDEAVARIEAVIERYPDFPPAHFNAGAFYGNLGDKERAIECFARYLELDEKGEYGDAEYARKQIATLRDGEDPEGGVDPALAAEDSDVAATL